MGLKVTIGTQFSPTADIGVLHHDLTRLDADTLPQPPAGIPVLNGKVLDISKRIYSTLLLTPDTDWDGPVIVKSDLNHFGIPERNHFGKPLNYEIRRKIARYSWRTARMLPKGVYPILKSPAKVPAWVWEDPELIVEKFLPERHNGYYCIRGWLFFGSRNFAYRLYGPDPLVKSNNAIGYDILTLNEVPDELQEIRERMGFDFGKFDYVEVDGKTILLDANKTPMTISFNKIDYADVVDGAILVDADKTAMMIGETYERFNLLAQGIQDVLK